MRLLGYRIYYYCWKTFLLATFHASRHSNHADHAPPSNAKQAVRRKENRGHNGQASKALLRPATLDPQGQPSARDRAPLRRCA